MQSRIKAPISDFCIRLIIRLFKIRLNSPSGNLIEASSLSRTTFNLAAADWRDKVNQDRRLRADWRKEKLAFMDDYIGSEATR